MRFYHQGKRKSNEPDAVSGCLLIIGFGAIVFLITLLDDLDDLKEHLFELVLVFIMGGSVIASMFSKRGRISNRHVVIDKNRFIIEDLKIPLADIVVDCYEIEGKFMRYHLRDKDGKIALYSVLEDDLIRHFLKTYPDLVKRYQETSHKHDGPYITVVAEGRKLYYNLDTGKYTIKPDKKLEISHIPIVYTYDGKYKKGKPLKKRNR